MKALIFLRPTMRTSHSHKASSKEMDIFIRTASSYFEKSRSPGSLPAPARRGTSPNQLFFYIRYQQSCRFTLNLI
jgi:hypothetical protein